jgi:hypothetical protein
MHPAAITTFVAGLVGTVSALVATLKELARYVAAAGLVMPLIVNATAVLAASAHELPASVMTTVDVAPDLAPVAVQPLKSAPRTIVGAVGIPAANALAKTTVTVFVLARAPVALLVNPIVQLAETPAV